MPIRDNMGKLSLQGVDVAVGAFFFQAEDGIRDLTVTGVQTCALPISGEGATNILPGVTVKLTGPSAGPAPQSTVTDAEGHYEFTQLAAGTYTIEASAEDRKSVV